jgi:hypothetical protein
MQRKHASPGMSLPQEPALSIIIPVDPCDCHEDPELLAPVTQAVYDGLLPLEKPPA